jgi:hypothetical protein
MARGNEQDPNREQQPAGNLDDPHSRRKFLRAAVVSTAGVAGAAGVAGVILARNGGSAPGVLTQTFVLASGPQVSGIETACASFEDSHLTGTALSSACPDVSGLLTPSEYYFIFTAYDLPAGTYSFDAGQFLASPMPGPGPCPDSLSYTPFSSSSKPLEYVNPGNDVYVSIITPANPDTTSCTPAPAGGQAPGNGIGDLPVDGSTATTNLTVTAGQDVQIYVHLQLQDRVFADYGGVKIVCVQGRLYSGTSVSGTPVLTATAFIVLELVCQ